jgi:hypothetical protein
MIHLWTLISTPVGLYVLVSLSQLLHSCLIKSLAPILQILRIGSELVIRTYFSMRLDSSDDPAYGHGHPRMKTQRFVKTGPVLVFDAVTLPKLLVLSR